MPAPKVVSNPVPVLLPMPTTKDLVPPAQPNEVLATTPEPSKETGNSGPQRSVPSVSDFLDAPLPHKSSPTPSVPRVIVPETDLLDMPDTHPLRPPNSSPVESEPEGDRENTRLVSIEDFLRPDPVPRTKVCLLDMSSLKAVNKMPNTRNALMLVFALCFGAKTLFKLYLEMSVCTCIHVIFWDGAGICRRCDGPSS